MYRCWYTSHWLLVHSEFPVLHYHNICNMKMKIHKIFLHHLLLFLSHAVIQYSRQKYLEFDRKSYADSLRITVLTNRQNTCSFFTNSSSFNDNNSHLITLSHIGTLYVTVILVHFQLDCHLSLEQTNLWICISNGNIKDTHICRDYIANGCFHPKHPKQCNLLQLLYFVLYCNQG